MKKESEMPTPGQNPEELPQAGKSPEEQEEKNNIIEYLDKFEASDDKQIQAWKILEEKIGINENFSIYDFFRKTRDEVEELGGKLVDHREKVDELGRELDNSSEDEIKIILNKIKKIQDEGIDSALLIYKKVQNSYHATSMAIEAVDKTGAFYHNINREAKELFSDVVRRITWNLALGLGMGLSYASHEKLRKSDYTDIKEFDTEGIKKLLQK